VRCTVAIDATKKARIARAFSVRVLDVVRKGAFYR
jgi:hypothetical protein